jgi:hypothetical protein
MREVTRSVVSEVVVYFNFGFSDVNLDSKSISQYALTDLLYHLRTSITARAYNEEEKTLTWRQGPGLAISKLEIDEIVFVIQPAAASSKSKYNFKMTFKLFHTSSSITTSAFEDIDKITKKMFEKVTKKTIDPEFECSPCFVKPDFHATCTRQHISGVASIT